MAKKKLTKKKKVVLIVSISAAAAAVAAGAFFIVPKILMAKNLADMQNKQSAMVQQATVTTGTISNTVVGTGTLADDDPEDVKIPTGIMINKVLVESGDNVTEGQALATVDMTSVETAISEIQSSISSIDTQLKAIGDETEDETCTATLSGRVKKIYMKEGDSVADVMKTSGRLMTISADGYLAVNLSNSGSAAAGDAVTVTLSDGTTVSGTVESAAGDTVTVLLTDEGTTVGDTVSVTSSGGTALGSGTLYIHQPYDVTGTSGTAGDIYVVEDEAIETDEELFELNDVSDTSTKDQLLAERQDETDALNEMLDLKNSGEILSPYTGTIAGINVSDDTEVTKSSSASSSTSASTGTSGSGSSGLKTTAYTADDASEGKLTASGFTLMSVSLNPSSSGTEANSTDTAASVSAAASSEAAQVGTAESTTASSSAGTGTGSTSGTTSVVTEPIQLSAINLPLSSPKNSVLMTETTLNAAIAKLFGTENPTYTVASVTWKDNNQQGVITLTAADGYCFNPSNNGVAVTVAGTSYEYYLLDDVSGVSDGYYETMVLTVDFTSKTSSSGTNSTSSAVPGTSSSVPSSTSDSTAAIAPSASAGVSGSSGSAAASGSVSGSGSTAASGTSSGTSSASSSSSSEDLYSQYETAGFTVSTNENMLITISVDELDILSVKTGQAVSVTLDALDGQTFDGTVQSIDTTGSNSGGVTKFTVTISVPKTDDMLSGMSATATITVGSAENVLTIPAAALQEEGDTDYVYTSEDENGNLSGKTEVTAGLSDDNTVEITEGLSEGQTVYYSMNTGTTISNDDSSSSTFNMMGGGMGGGTMPSGGNAPSGGGGNMPSGGGPGGNG